VGEWVGRPVKRGGIGGGAGLGRFRTVCIYPLHSQDP